LSVNHHIELTEEEKAQARQEAIRQYQQEQMNKMRNRGGDTQGIEERGQIQGNEEPFLRFDVHGRQYRGENA
jgi:hypothetical protein